MAMEKNKKKNLIIFGLVLVVVFVILFFRYSVSNEDDKISCKYNEITPQLIKELGYEGEYNDEMIRQLNEETPYCKDLCKEQLEYSKQYPDEWYTTNNFRKQCKELGITLP